MKLKCRSIFEALRLFMTICFMLLITACNQPKSSKLISLSKFTQKKESRIIEIYKRYIDKISNSNFPLVSIQSKTNLFRDSIYATILLNDQDLVYLPVTMWQIYSLSGSALWRSNAEIFSEIQNNIHLASNTTQQSETLPNLKLTQYFISQDQRYYNSLMNSLLIFISNPVKSLEECSDSLKIKDICLESLLNNELLFFGSKETGDPTYKLYAVKNSELISRAYFYGNTNLPLGVQIDSASESANSVKYKKLSVKDYSDLAVGLYSYTMLYKETGFIKYLTLTQNIAAIFTDALIGHKISESEHFNHQINQRIDMVSQSLVCNALYDLGELDGNHYRETANKYFNHILDTLENTSELDNESHPFKLFYYLLDYEMRKQGISS